MHDTGNGDQVFVPTQSELSSTSWSSCPKASSSSAPAPSSPTAGTGKISRQAGPSMDSHMHVVWGGIEDSAKSEESSCSNHPGAAAILEDRKSGVLFQEISSDGTQECTSGDSGAEMSRLALAARHLSGESKNGEMQQFDTSGAGLHSLLDKVPVDENGERMSVGSIMHDQDCTPCAFLLRRQGCVNGILCNFCHFSHDAAKQKKPNRARPCKGQRLRYRKQFNRLKEAVEVAPEEFNPNELELPPSIAANSHLKTKLLTRLSAEKNYLLSLKDPQADMQQQGQDLPSSCQAQSSGA